MRASGSPTRCRGHRGDGFARLGRRHRDREPSNYFGEAHIAVASNAAAQLRIRDVEEPRGDPPIAGKTVVFTGTLEKMTGDEAPRRRRAPRPKVSGSVSTGTDYVVRRPRSRKQARGGEEARRTILTETSGSSPSRYFPNRVRSPSLIPANAGFHRFLIAAIPLLVPAFAGTSGWVRPRDATRWKMRRTGHSLAPDQHRRLSQPLARRRRAAERALRARARDRRRASRSLPRSSSSGSTSARVDRRQRDRLEAASISRSAPGDLARLDDQDQIFDADAVCAGRGNSRARSTGSCRGCSAASAEFGDALRPLVDRRDRSRRRGRCRDRNRAPPPIEHGRAKASSCAPEVPSGNTARAMAIWPLSTRVNCRASSGVGAPTAIVRVTSVVPS